MRLMAFDSGQVPDDELRDLIRHSYELVKNA